MKVGFYASAKNFDLCQSAQSMQAATGQHFLLFVKYHVLIIWLSVIRKVLYGSIIRMPNIFLFLHTKQSLKINKSQVLENFVQWIDKATAHHVIERQQREVLYIILSKKENYCLDRDTNSPSFLRPTFYQ